MITPERNTMLLTGNSDTATQSRPKAATRVPVQPAATTMPIPASVTTAGTRVVEKPSMIGTSAGE
jgi:hypothetical protein